MQALSSRVSVLRRSRAASCCTRSTTAQRRSRRRARADAPQHGGATAVEPLGWIGAATIVLPFGAPALLLLLPGLLLLCSHDGTTSVVIVLFRDTTTWPSTPADTPTPLPPFAAGPLAAIGRT